MMPSTARAVTTALQSMGSLDLMLLPPGLWSAPTRSLSLGTPRLQHARTRPPPWGTVAHPRRARKPDPPGRGRRLGSEPGAEQRDQGRLTRAECEPQGE